MTTQQRHICLTALLQTIDFPAEIKQWQEKKKTSGRRRKEEMKRSNCLFIPTQGHRDRAHEMRLKQHTRGKACFPIRTRWSRDFSLPRMLNNEALKKQPVVLLGNLSVNQGVLKKHTWLQARHVPVALINWCLIHLQFCMKWQRIRRCLARNHKSYAPDHK